MKTGLYCFVLTALFMPIFAAPAYAYIGPGLGAGTVAVILGFIASILLAIFSLFWYPIKRLLHKLRRIKKKTSES